MITANRGGMSLRNALGAFFFMMLHNKVEHGCLTKKALETHEKQVKDAAASAKSHEGATLTAIFGLQDAAAFALEEWSFLSFEQAYIFLLLADTAIEQTQRWIAEPEVAPVLILFLLCVQVNRAYQKTRGSMVRGERLRLRGPANLTVPPSLVEPVKA